jgi:thiamine pyrophosphate-dependent acetolactate synthase large subunit-like protein
MMADAERVDQRDATAFILEEVPEAAIVSNLGTASYTLIDISDRDRNFYMNGAMGVTTPLGHGIAMGTDETVVVLAGDGSLLMSLGSLATVAENDLSNLVIVVWENDVFETTGGQRNLATNVDFANVASNSDVRSWSVTNTSEFEDAFVAAVEYDGAALVSCKTEPYNPEDAPPLDYAHSHVKHRFRQALSRAPTRQK